MSKHNGKAKFATSISVLCLYRVIDYYVMSLAFRDHPSNHNCMYMCEFDVSNKYLQQRILQCHIIYFYRQPINMRKGNVFSHVCPSVNYSIHGVGVHVQGPAPPHFYRTLAPALLYTGPWPLSPSPGSCHSLICSNFFTVTHGLSESGWMAFDWNAFFYIYKTTVLDILPLLNAY